MTAKKSKSLRDLIYSAVFLALAFVLPFLTGQIQTFGQMLLPMHLPVLLCGFVCGWQWGLGVGFLAPLLRSLTLGMPPFFPMAISMAFELAAYGAIAGLLHRALPKGYGWNYVALVVAMLVGRLVWGAVRFACTGLSASAFGLTAFWTGAFASAWPGIVLQIVVIPPLVALFDRLRKQA